METVNNEVTEPERNFDQSLATFLEGVKKIVENHSLTLPVEVRETITADIGSRYVRVMRVRQGETSGSAHCFVDKRNGDVLKAASWKAPAKHARGNIFDPDNGLNCVDEYGAAYLKRGRKATR